MDGFPGFLEALAHLISACAWPGVVLFLALRFSPSIANVLSRIGDFSFKGLGVEASAKLDRVRDDLKDATISRLTDRVRRGSSLASEPFPLKESIRSISPRDVISLSGCKILWVDDHSENNLSEIKAFTTAGAIVQTAPNTSSALSKLGAGRFDVIISDMSRPPDEVAGYTLLDALGANHPPFVIYASSINSDQIQQAKERGAYGSTSDPVELFRMVSDAAIGRML